MTNWLIVTKYKFLKWQWIFYHYLMFSSLMHRWPQPILAILFRPFGFIAPEILNYLAFYSFDFEWIWWRLSQKRSCALTFLWGIYTIDITYFFLFLSIRVTWLKTIHMNTRNGVLDYTMAFQFFRVLNISQTSTIY